MPELVVSLGFKIKDGIPFPPQIEHEIMRAAAAEFRRKEAEVCAWVGMLSWFTGVPEIVISAQAAWVWGYEAGLRAKEYPDA